MKLFSRNTVLLAIALISLVMHFPHFSKDLVSIHVWRQTETQSTIVNFYEEDMNILNPTRNERGSGDGIFRMEFPLMQWMVAATYTVFGNHLVITRIFMFVIGLFSIAGMYLLLRALSANETMALAGAWAFNFSPSFYYYTINPLPDNLALCCSIWGLAMFFTFIGNKKTLTLLMGGLFLSIGALCKLPFILYFIAPMSWFVLRLYKDGVKWDYVNKLMMVSLYLLPPLAWYLSVVPQWDVRGIVNGMFKNDLPVATVLGYLRFNLISTLPELLLNYGSLLFFLAGFYFMVKNKAISKPAFPVLALLGLTVIAYFLFELNMIGNVHDYYLFPFMPLLFILVGYGAANLLGQQQKGIRYVAIALLMILPVTAYIRMVVRWNVDEPGFNKDLLTYKQDLRAAVPKSDLCIVGNDDSHHIFFYYVDKKGWGFAHDDLTAANLSGMIDGGARYLYSDSRIIDGDTAVSKYFNRMILERGSVRVFSLKKETVK
jgi:hypothetical protein